jgi:hypothetical protein
VCPPGILRESSSGIPANALDKISQQAAAGIARAKKKMSLMGIALELLRCRHDK